MADQPFDPELEHDPGLENDPGRENDAEVELDIRAFLPEGTDLDGDWGDDAPEPELPAWARDDAHAAPTQTPDPVAPTASAPVAESEPDEEVDLGVLEGIEADLIEVDDAIAALDAGDQSRSALLQRLVEPS